MHLQQVHTLLKNIKIQPHIAKMSHERPTFWTRHFQNANAFYKEWHRLIEK